MSGRAPDIYWRRRVFVLAAGIGVLVLIAWTINGALGGVGNARQAADATHTGQHGHHVMAAAATTSAALPTPATTATLQPTAKASPQRDQAKHSQARHSQAKHGPQHARHAAAGPGSAGACPRGSVVLSLFTPKYHYAGQQPARFEVDVVSTAARPCSFNVGTKYVRVVVRAGGERRVWGSADCVQSAGSRMERLTRGVPAVLRISWDRKTSAPGCRVPGQAARSGTYTATARSGPLHSQALIFVLGGPHVAVP